jgi:hypothetical protein
VQVRVRRRPKAPSQPRPRVRPRTPVRHRHRRPNRNRRRTLRCPRPPKPPEPRIPRRWLRLRRTNGASRPTATSAPPCGWASRNAPFVAGANGQETPWTEFPAPARARAS